MNLPQPVQHFPPTDTAVAFGSSHRRFLAPALWGLVAATMTAGTLVMLGYPALSPVQMFDHPVPARSQTTGQLDQSASPELKRLAEEVARLSADREKLTARLEILERQVGTKTVASSILENPAVPAITGSVGRTSTPMSYSTPADVDAIKDGPARRTAFALDLGSAASVDRLKDRWAAMNELHGSILKKLEPRVALGRTKDGAVELRLIAGPFNDAAAAVKACSELQRQPGTCEPKPFDGEPLSKS